MKLFKTLENKLKKENNFVADDGELKKWVVLNKAQNFDAVLIESLLDDEDLKAKFFIEVGGALVFNQNLFVQFLEQKNYLNDSYTQYKNKVGLTIDGKYLKQRNEVALVWPFKDCILEGGQSREEDKREEIFFNEILAQDEITQLLEPKVLTNAKVYDKDGQQDFNGFSRDAEINKKRGLPENTITDNLIIKGNNLLALHSLKKEFAGKVKLIYIDPPYNTGKDGFKYNDSFNHSTWLTFMKNRLTVARELLKEDGVIFVQCDDNEQAYLKILMDEVFWRENFIGMFLWKKNKSGNQNATNISLQHEYILSFGKTSNVGKWRAQYDKDDLKDYKEEDKKGKFYWKPVKHSTRGKNITINHNGDNILVENCVYSKDTTLSMLRSNEAIFRKNTKGIKQLYKKQRIGEGVIPYSFLNPKKFKMTEDAVREIYDLFNNNIFDTPKPEVLINHFLEISTKKNDIVLDYHLGSGTTSAVAHKMNRQYIGVEQMDYIETVAVERLKKVINGEQGGISKSVNWQGGGSFTYLELKKYNQTFIEQIEQAKDSKALLKIWEQMKEKSFLNYNVDIKKQDKYIEEFKLLELHQQKEHLVELLDKNQLYVNLSSINDKDFAVSKEEKKVTKDFYN